MRLLRDSSVFLPKYYGAVMALGNFDGLHLGHQAVLAQAIALAKQTGKPAALMTFEPHPRRIFTPHLPPLRIIPLNEKLHLLQKMGLDFLRIVRFTKAFATTRPEDFITHVLHEQLHVSHVVTGEDFVFGHNREGNALSLNKTAQQLGFAATTCPPVEVGAERCSSTRIREALAQGKVELAALLLGRPYHITGRVRQGDKRGRTIGFPTANLVPSPVFLPAYGVYAVRAKIKNKEVMGVANLGLRPTFAGSALRLEVHLFDWQEAIYGERMEVELVRHIRGEQKFDGMDALKAQITKDCAEAKLILADA
jgi:riboflavin kinase/FMN adenylyltransferase